MPQTIKNLTLPVGVAAALCLFMANLIYQFERRVSPLEAAVSRVESSAALKVEVLQSIAEIKETLAVIKSDLGHLKKP